MPLEVSLSKQKVSSVDVASWESRDGTSVLPPVVKLLSTLDPSHDSTALSTDGRVLNTLWDDRGAAMTTGSSSPSWGSWPSPGPGPGPITQDLGLDTANKTHQDECFTSNCFPLRTRMDH